MLVIRPLNWPMISGLPIIDPGHRGAQARWKSKTAGEELMLNCVMTRRHVHAAALAVAALLGLAGPRAAIAADPIVIGSVQDLTGPVATLGQYGKRGVDLAIAEVNAAGGVNGRPIELVSLN